MSSTTSNDPLASVNTSTVVGVNTLHTNLTALQSTVATLQTQLSASEPSSVVSAISDIQSRLAELENVVVALCN